MDVKMKIGSMKSLFALAIGGSLLVVNGCANAKLRSSKTAATSSMTSQQYAEQVVASGDYSLANQVPPSASYSQPAQPVTYRASVPGSGPSSSRGSGGSCSTGCCN